MYYDPETRINLLVDRLPPYNPHITFIILHEEAFSDIGS